MKKIWKTTVKNSIDKMEYYKYLNNLKGGRKEETIKSRGNKHKARKG